MSYEAEYCMMNKVKTFHKDSVNQFLKNTVVKCMNFTECFMQNTVETSLAQLENGFEQVLLNAKTD